MMDMGSFAPWRDREREKKSVNYKLIPQNNYCWAQNAAANAGIRKSTKRRHKLAQNWIITHLRLTIKSTGALGEWVLQIEIIQQTSIKKMEISRLDIGVI